MLLPGVSSLSDSDKQQQQPPAESAPDSGGQGAAPAVEKDVIYDVAGNKFEWRWHPEAGPAGKWKLYAAGTDNVIHEQPDEEVAASGATAPPEAAAVDEPAAEQPAAERPAPEQPVQAADAVHDEL